MAGNFDITQISTYFNYAILIMIGLGALGGFLAGMFKSVYNFCVFLGLLLLGWFLSPLLTTYLMDFDISSVYPLNISGIDVTSINAFLLSFIELNYPDYAALMAEGTETFALVSQLIFMVVRLVVIIVWLVLMYTVFKVLFWIVYQFVKPRHRTAEGKRTKKTMGSRLGGTLVGALKSLLTVMLLSIPLSGLCSLTSSVVGMLPANETGDEAPYVMFLTSDGAILRETAAPEIPGFTAEQTDAVLAFMNNYRTTYAGIASGLLKVGGQPIDEYAFDEIMSFTVGESQVKLRLEIQTALEVYTTLTSNIEGELTLEAVMALDEETLTGIFEDISTLKIIQVAIPVGIEFVTETDILGTQMDAVSQFVDIETLADQLKDIDYGTELENIGAAVVDVSQLGLFGSELSGLELYMSLDAETVSSLLDSVGELELVDILGGVGMGYLLSNETFINKLTELGLTTDDLVFDEVDWGDEIANLGDVYATFQVLGITSTDFAMIDFEQMTDEELNAFATALFQSTVLSDNNGVLVQVGLSFLPEEYKDFITATSIEAGDLASLLGLGKVLLSSGIMDEDFDPLTLLSEDNIVQLADYISGSDLLSSNISNIISSLLSSVQLPEGLTITIDPEFDWSGENGRTELIALFTAASKLVELGISDADFLSNLTGETIEELSDAISDSQILMGNIGNILDYFLSDPTLTGGMTIEIGTWDWTSEAGKTEFKALLGALGSILSSNLLTDPDLANLSDETIADLADKLSASAIIRNNLSNILNQMISTSSFEFEIAAFDDPNDWTALEINSLLTSVRIIMSKTNFPEDLFSLTEEELDTLLSSELICDAIVSVLEDYTGPEGSLNGLLIISNVTQWKDIRDELGNITTEGELRKLFRSASILLGPAPDFDNPDNLVDPNNILNLSDGTADTNLDGVVDELDDDALGDILDSQVLLDTIINKLIEFGTPDGETEAVLIVLLAADDPRWEDEIRNFIKAVKVVLGDPIDLNNINVDPNVLKDLTNDRGGEDDEVGTILQSIIITDTIIDKIIGLGEGESTSLVINLTQEDARWRDTETEDGEIRKLIRAIQIIFSDPASDLNNPNIDPNVILNLTDGTADTNGDLVVDELDSDEIGEIFASQIASDSMIKVLYDLGQGDAPALVINLTLTDASWYDDGTTDGELRNFVRAVKVVLGDPIDLNNINVDPNILKTLSNERGGEDDEVGTILKSIIITDTIIKEIVGLGGDTSSLVINLTQEDARWRDTETEDGEIRKLIRAIQIIFSDPASDLNNPNIDPNVILNLTDGTVDTNGDLVVDELDSDEIGEIFASVIASDSMIKVLYDLGQGDAPSLVINLTLTDARWYDAVETEGELRHFIRAIKVILGDSPDLNNVNVDANVLKTLTLGEIDPAEDDVKTIQASIIARDTIIDKIIDIANPTEGEASLIVNLGAADEAWFDQFVGETRTDGEIRKLIKAIQIIFQDPADDINNPNIDANLVLELTNGTEDTNGDLAVDELDSDELGEILRSRIISDSIIKQLRDLGAGENPTLIVDLAADDPRWNDSETGDGEIRNLVIAVGIVLVEDLEGNIDLNNPTIKPQADIMRLPDADITTLLRSIILSKTIVKEVIANATLTIPAELASRDAAAWYDEGETHGELHNLISVASILMDDGATTFSSSKFLNMTEAQIDTVLASLIAKETIKNELRGMSAIIIDEANPLFIWDDTYVGEDRTDGELRKLLVSATLLVENEEINIDKILTLSNAQLDQLVQSRIIVDSAVRELTNMTSPTGSLYQVLYLPEDPAPDYYLGSSGELKRFFIALQYLKNGNTTPEQGVADMTAISLASLTDEHQPEILASDIVMNTIIVNIQNEATTGTTLKLPAKFTEGDPLYDEAAWDTEVPNILAAMEVFLGTNADLAAMNISADNFTNLTDGTVDTNGDLVVDENDSDEIGVIVASEIIAYTIVQEIETEASRVDPVIIIPVTLADEDWYGDQGELRKFLMAVSALTTTGLQVDAAKFLNLTDPEISRVVASAVLSNSIVKKIEAQRNEPDSLITLPDKFNPDSGAGVYEESLWHGETGELAKTLKALRNLGMTDYNADISIRPLFDEANDVIPEVILASEVVEATIINKIETEAAVGGSLNGTLIIPNDITWERTVVLEVETDEGELRRFLKAIDIILDGGELESAAFDVEKFFDDAEQPILLNSRIIEASVVNKIEAEASVGGSLENKLVYPSDWVQSDWYGTEGELVDFLASIEIVLNGDSFDNASFEVDKFLGPDRATLLTSRVIEASVVEYVIDSANPVDGMLKDSLYLPSGLETNNPEWYTLSGNEINRFLDAINIIIGPAETYANANFSVDTILGPDQSTLLDSKVVEASAVRYVIESAAVGGTMHDTLIIPVDLQTNGVLWYGATGELAKFLDSIEIIIGPAGTYTAAQFDVDTILGPDQEALLESRVTEASVINQIKLSTNLIFPDKTVPADVIKYYYLSDEDIVWERTYTDEVVTDIGELRRFLAGISAINTATGGDFATLVFDMNALMSVNFTTVLESRILEATVADMVDGMLTSSLNGFIKTPDDGFQWYYHATSTDVTSGAVRRGEYILIDDVVDTLQYSDLLGFLNSIQQMDAAGLDFENITYTTVAACDSTALSTALWDYSRVMRGSIATMLNKTLEAVPDPFHIKPTFNDGQFTSKQDVKDQLDIFKAFVALL